MSDVIVGLDLDGVLYPWHEAFVTEYNNANCCNISVKEFWQNLGKYVPTNVGKDNIAAVLSCYTSESPMLDTLQWSQELATVATIHYVTHRPKSIRTHTKNWLVKHRFPTPENIHFVEGLKVDKCLELGITHFVDDQPFNLDPMFYAGIWCMLVKRPYNVESSLYPRASHSSKALEALFYEISEKSR